MRNLDKNIGCLFMLDTISKISSIQRKKSLHVLLEYAWTNVNEEYYWNWSDSNISKATFSVNLT